MISMSRRGLLGRTGLLGGPFAVATEGASLLRTDEVRQERGKLKVIVTGGHPGDPEYGCGGTIARYSDLGHEVVLLYLNNGEPAGQKPRAGCTVLASPRPRRLARSSGPARSSPGKSTARRWSTPPTTRRSARSWRPRGPTWFSPTGRSTTTPTTGPSRCWSMTPGCGWTGASLSTTTRSPMARTPCSFRRPTTGHHRDRTAEAPGLLRPRQPGPGQVLRVARAGHPAAGSSVAPACGGLHPPHPEPGFLAAARVVMDSSSHGRPAEVPFPRQ